MVWRPRLGRRFRGRVIRHISRFEGQNRQERGKIKSKKGKRGNIERATGAKGERSSGCRISKWTGGGSGRATDTNSGQSSGCRGRGGKVHCQPQHTYSGRIESRVSTNHGAWLNKPSWQKSWRLRRGTCVSARKRSSRPSAQSRNRGSRGPRTLQPDVRTKRPSTGHGRGNRYGVRGAKAQLIEVTEI